MEAAKIRRDGLGMAGRVVYGMGGIWGVWVVYGMGGICVVSGCVEMGGVWVWAGWVDGC